MNKKNISIIITMAGLGSRFKNAGYYCPKYMIEVKGKTLFEWSMDSLLDFNPYVKRYVFVVRREDNSKKFILEKCQKYNINDVRIVEIDYLTDGQATTCMLALDECEDDSPILIYNIDTYVEPFTIKYEDISGDGHIPCFQADGNHWSFVKADNDGDVIEVREKVRISNNCTLGAYYFSSVALYRRLYNEYYQDSRNIEKNEKYIAPLYNYMIQLNMRVTFSVVDSKKVHVLGTPEELKQFESQFSVDT